MTAALTDTCCAVKCLTFSQHFTFRFLQAPNNKAKQRNIYCYVRRNFCLYFGVKSTLYCQ